MKLLLTSAGWWKNPQIGKAFLKLVNKKPSAIRIFLAITPTKYLTRNRYILRQFKQFKDVQIPKQNITFFQLDRKVKPDELEDIDVIFVFGGNTFEYLDRIRKTGLDKLIKHFVKRGGVYLGLSAGSYVVCPTIEAAGWKHADQNVIKLKNLRGLNLVPFLITAHFREALRPTIKRAAQRTKYQTIALTDQQAVLISGKRKQIIGGGKKHVFNS